MFNRPRPLSGGLAWAIPVGLAAVLLASPPSWAHRHHRGGYGAGVSLTDPSKDAALIVDGTSGKSIYARNADIERHPASLTKMMTLYLLFDALKQGKLTMSSPLAVSAHAASQKPTNLHLSSGDQIPVETAIKAIVVRSANDVAVAIAEGIGGTESHFAELMTEKARDLGMRSTYYHNASGLPDPLQITTASDLALLARHLGYDFPQYFHYFSTPSFYFRGVNYPTHDNLIGRYQGADGIKTGYTGMSGFNLVSSVVRGGEHLIGVVMGGRTAHMRDREMVNLLDWSFAQGAQNPSLIARTQVPWQVAENTPAVSPIVINATNQPSAAAPGAVASLNGAPALALAEPPPPLPAASDDEESAEARTNEGNADLSSHAQSPARVLAPPPATVQPPVTLALREPTPPVPAPIAPRPAIAPMPKPVPMIVAQLIKPRHKPAEIAAPPKPPVLVALNRPQPPAPVLRPAAPAPELGEGDIGDDRIPLPSPAAAVLAPLSHDWMIQIGAFASQPLARAQLAAYAEKSMDILGQADRVVLPFQSVGGKTVYRARFGPFPEREAREVCTRLEQRGQTCFAANATR